MVTTTNDKCPRGLSDERRQQYLRQSISFVSTCPKCRQAQYQRGPRNTIQRLLTGRHPIEAYCVTCDVFWPITTAERIGIVRDLTG